MTGPDSCFCSSSHPYLKLSSKDRNKDNSYKQRGSRNGISCWDGSRILVTTISKFTYGVDAFHHEPAAYISHLFFGSIHASA